MPRITTAVSRALRRGIFFAAWLIAGGVVLAADARLIVGSGATKDEVLNAYGWPTGQSQLGTKEILTYPQGTVTLQNGRVERVDFSPNAPWPAPLPRPMGMPGPKLVQPIPEPKATSSIEAPPTAPAVTPPVAPAPAAAEKNPATREGNVVGAVMASASWNILLALGSGAVIAAGFVWMLWRGPRELRKASTDPAKKMFAGLGLGKVPTMTQLATWPLERVRLLTAGLCEETGQQVTLRPDSDHELDLTPSGATTPTVRVCCWAASAGPVHVKAIREFSGTLVAADIAECWFVSPAGFFDEARAVAKERGIVLIDGEELLARLRRLPPLGIRRVLARVCR